LLGAPAAVIATVIFIGVHEKIIKYFAKIGIIIHIAAQELLIREIKPPPIAPAHRACRDESTHPPTAPAHRARPSSLSRCYLQPLKNDSATMK